MGIETNKKIYRYIKLESKNEKIGKKAITKEELEVINDWLDFYECQKIRACFYGDVENERYLKKAQILDNIFKKYDRFLDKSEPIYRGIRFRDKEEFVGKFAYQDEIVVKSHRSSYKIVNITKENEVLIV